MIRRKKYTSRDPDDSAKVVKNATESSADDNIYIRLLAGIQQMSISCVHIHLPEHRLCSSVAIAALGSVMTIINYL